VNGDDTIAALSTAQGRSAIALIRLSGGLAFDIAREVTLAELPPPRTPALRTLYSDGGASAPLDRCLLTVFPAPHSYTGEDSVELSVHGGFMVPAMVLDRIIGAGARAALPGEFTRRAFLNGTVDLLQAEAIADLIDARSHGAAAAAFRQLDGGLTRRVEQLRNAIIEVEALIAYDIDFPEEDDGPIDRSRITDACDVLIAQLSGLLATAGMGEMLREGVLVVIAGVPNAGKSSLFNALVGRQRALVTDIPGTTRDAIEVVVDAGDWTLRLVDTAGLRATTEVVERLGIEVAEQYLAEAQLVLACGEGATDLETAITRSRLLSTAPVVAVRTKADLTPGDGGPVQELAQKFVNKGEALSGVYNVSAHSGEGLAELLLGVAAVLSNSHGEQTRDAPLLLRSRHQRAVALAREELNQFSMALAENSLPMAIAGTHLRSASYALETLIGSVGVEDVLDRVFSSFCVGK
jgi:tRNA modification GTPase